MSSESEGNIHNDGDNILKFSSYHEEIRIQSLDTHIISEQTMTEKAVWSEKERHGKRN